VNSSILLNFILLILSHYCSQKACV